MTVSASHKGNNSRVRRLTQRISGGILVVRFKLLKVGVEIQNRLARRSKMEATKTLPSRQSAEKFFKAREALIAQEKHQRSGQHISQTVLRMVVTSNRLWIPPVAISDSQEGMLHRQCYPQ
jgi:hypothetical protein